MAGSEETRREAAAADLLTSARSSNQRIASLGEHAPQSTSEAHHIADLHAAQLGSVTAGWKVGATSTHAMQLLQSPGPFAGRIFAGTVSSSGETINHETISPSVECEFGFWIGADLPARGDRYSLADVKAATEAVSPAVELVDSRFEDMLSVGYLSLIADSGANGGAIVGERFAVSDLPDLKTVGVSCQVDGETVGEGSGADILGDPWLALEWLANHLAARSVELRAGQLVLSGTCTGIAPLTRGSAVVASYADLGDVSFTY